MIRLELEDEPVRITGTENGVNGDDDNNSNLTVDFGFLRYDFGDHLDTYGTTGLAGGAQHGLDGQTFLGNSVDHEANGVPTSTASGDDSSGDTPYPPGDEDGVVFTSAIMPNGTATIDVIALNGGALSMWVDWNDDGNFDDAGEQEFSEQILPAGTSSLSFATTAGNVPKTLRTRLSIDP